MIHLIVDLDDIAEKMVENGYAHERDADEVGDGWHFHLASAMEELYGLPSDVHSLIHTKLHGNPNQ